MIVKSCNLKEMNTHWPEKSLTIVDHGIQNAL